MKSKGYTDGILKRIEGIPKGSAFHLKDIRGGLPRSAIGSAVRRLLSHGIIIKVGFGEYRRAAQNPVAAYKRRKGKRKTSDNDKQQSLFEPTREKPQVRVVPFRDGTDMIFIGGKVYLGTEVALVPLKGGKS